MSATIEDVTRGQLEAHHIHAPAIITPSIEGREHLLAECAESVKRQTIPVQHHIALDVTRAGPAAMRSAVLGVLDPGVEYVGFVDDDDLLDPFHVELLARELEDGADLAFSWHRTITGEGCQPAPQVERVSEWGDYAYGVMLGGRNLIPVTVLARRDLVVEAGAFRTTDRYEDYALWMRMLELGATVSVVSRETWTYRFLGANRTWSVL